MATPAERKAYFNTLDVPAFLERAEVQAFVGPNFEIFKAKWLKDHAKGKSPTRVLRAHWNLMAFLLWFAWFSYRKMWKPLAAATVTLVIAIFAMAWYEARSGRIVPNSAFSVPQLMLGLWGTNMYFQHIAGFFFEHGDAPSTALIEEKGGVSMMAGVLGSVAYLSALMGAIYIAYTIFPSVEP